MSTIHFVYSHGHLRSCPNAISNELTTRFISDGFTVIHYPWDDLGRVKPQKGDILLGHPNGLPFTFFRNSLDNSNWHKKLILYPFSHGLLCHSSFIEFFIAKCDYFLAITGHYWFDSISKSMYNHWLHKMIHLDLAVNRLHFPFIKNSFNQRGRRKFLYIGAQQSFKNIEYLKEIQKRTKRSFSWFGRGKLPMPGFKCYGYVDFQDDANMASITNHDFLISVGHSDPNPTTILEAMSWGLIPVCSRQSGYTSENEKGIINIPIDDIDAAVNVVELLQEISDNDLENMQEINRRRLEEHYNWDRFYTVVKHAMLSDQPILPVRKSLTNSLILRANALLISERSSFLRPSVLKRFILAAMRYFNKRNEPLNYSR